MSTRVPPQRTFHAIGSLVRAAWVSSAKEKVRFWVFIGLFLTANIVDLLVPWAIGFTLGVFVEDGVTEEAFQMSLWGIGAYVGLRLLHTLFHHLARHQQNQVAYVARMAAVQNVFSALVRFPLSWHVTRHSGENLSKLHRSAGAVESMVGTYLWQIVEGIVKVGFASIAIFALDFWVALNVTTVGGLSLFAMIYFNRQLGDAYRANNSFANKLNRICVDYLSNIVTVKTLGLERVANRYLRNQEDEGLQHCRRISRFSELKWSTTGIGYSLVTGSSLIIYFYNHQGLSQSFEIAQVYVLLNYLDRIFQAIGSFTGYYSGIIESSIAYEDATSLAGQDEQLLPEHGPRYLPNEWSGLVLSSVNYSYVPGEPGGLHSLSLPIKRGSKIALVGPSGGGKSTLLKVLGGIIRPHTCHIASDSGKQVPIEDIASLSLLVPQEPEIFSETLRFNLTMGAEIDPDEILHVASICRLGKVIDKLPLGLETFLAENGQNLSVGEKQRVSLARGLLLNGLKQLLLLDEPTSSLDPYTEREIFENLLSRYSARTVITACHRLNLMPLFDTIVFVSGGSVEETGSFHQLRERGGLFAQAWDDYEKGIQAA